jgi:caa(3)-type oxidase subunit IV
MEEETPAVRKQSLKTQTKTNAPKEVHPAYHRVFIILAIFTALEVGVSYLPYAIKVPLLIILAMTKAILVLLFFMHLQYDRPIFGAPFIIGLVLAIPIILTIVVIMPLVH